MLSHGEFSRGIVNQGNVECAVQLIGSGKVGRAVAVEVAGRAGEHEGIVGCVGSVFGEGGEIAERSTAVVAQVIEAIENLGVIDFVKTMNKQRVGGAVIVDVNGGAGELPGDILLAKLRKSEVAVILAAGEKDGAEINGRLAGRIVAGAGKQQIKGGAGDEVPADHVHSKASGNGRMIAWVDVYGLGDGTGEVAGAISEAGANGPVDQVSLAIMIDVPDHQRRAFAVGDEETGRDGELAVAVIEIDAHMGVLVGIRPAADDIRDAVAIEVANGGIFIEERRINYRGCGEIAGTQVQHDGHMQTPQEQQVRAAIVIEVGGEQARLAAGQGKRFGREAGLGKSAGGKNYRQKE